MKKKILKMVMIQIYIIGFVYKIFKPYFKEI